MQKSKQSFSEKVAYWLKVVSLGIMLGLGLQFAQAWVAPTAAPPLGNVGGPVTLNGNQTKTGSLALTAGGAYGTGALVIGSIALNGQLNNGSDNWIRLGDATGNVYGGKGLSADYLHTSTAFYSSNWSHFNSGSIGLAAGFFDGNSQANSAPKSNVGSITVNDVFLRSIGKWASEAAGGGGAPGNIVAGCIGAGCVGACGSVGGGYLDCWGGATADANGGSCPSGSVRKGAIIANTSPDWPATTVNGTMVCLR